MSLNHFQNYLYNNLISLKWQVNNLKFQKIGTLITSVLTFKYRDIIVHCDTITETCISLMRSPSAVNHHRRLTTVTAKQILSIALLNNTN